MDIRDWSQQVSSIARKLGVPVTGCEVLSSATHLILRLEGTDVVAKVGPRDELEALAREIRVAQHLESQGGLCLPLSKRLAPGPHLGAAIATSFWQYVPLVTGEVAPSIIGSSLQQLHNALASFGGHLPDFLEDIRYMIGLLEHTDRRWLSEARVRLLRAVIESGLSALKDRTLERVPLHGDAHPGNFTMTADGPRWLDFEAACRGPREWDVAAGPYPPPAGCDSELLDVLVPIRAAFAVIWCALKPNPNVEEAECIAYHTGELAKRLGG